MKNEGMVVENKDYWCCIYAVYLSILHFCEVLVLARPLHFLQISASQCVHATSRGLRKR